MTDSKTNTPVILVCDDDRDARSLICSTISALGYDTREAYDGVDAQAQCRAALPDLIVMDIMMPRMTGLEFVQWFREEIQDPFVPILMLTALDQIESRVEGLSLGADDYVTKPFHFRELQARVQALLRVKELMMILRSRSRELEIANAELQKTQEQLVRQEREMIAARMAGAAAHNLGQPMTTILLNSYVLEKYFASSSGDLGSHFRQAGDAARTIKDQCGAMKEILAQLQTIDPQSSREYVGDLKILDIHSKKNT